MLKGSWLLPKLADLWLKVVTYLIGAGALGLLALFGVPPALQGWVESQPVTFAIRDFVYGLTDRPMEKGAYNILVADLANDTDTNQTEHVGHSLERQFDAGSQSSRVRVQRLKRVHRAAKGVDTASDLRNLHEAGRKLLTALNADVLIWGEVAKSASDKVILRLRFLPRSGDASNSPRSYALNEVYELSPSFGNDLAALLAAIAASSITPAIEDPNARGRYMADVLKPLVDKLGPLLEQPPAAFTPDQVADLRLTYLSGSFALGRQRGDPQQLRNAVDMARKILQYWTREKAPDKWAKTQNLLGAALTRLGHREQGTALLEEAAVAYGEALKEWTRASDPAQGATVQNNLANALWAIGVRDTSNTARLQDAVRTYRTSLEEVDRSKTPLEWALHHNNIGNALVSLGERTRSAAPLREAVLAFETALLERTRERVPLDWSASKNGLGEALTVWGEIEGSSQRLDQALTAFAEALEERPRAQLPLAWGVTRHGTARALAKLGELNGKTATLEEARRAAEEALTALGTDPGTRIESDARATLEKIESALKTATTGQRQ